MSLISFQLSEHAREDIPGDVIRRFAVFMSCLHDRHGISMDVLYEEAVRTLKPFSCNDLQDKRVTYEIASRLGSEIDLLHTGGMQ